MASLLRPALSGTAPSPSLVGEPRAIVDIGSNSIRLVVYAGSARAPSVLFNEKVMAGLGATLAEDGLVPPHAVDLTLATLARFQMLAAHMGARRLNVVATAALRDARNGPDVLARIRNAGIDVRLLPGDAEARTSALGVISTIPDADGVVGDLGGGSLELIRVTGGQTGAAISLPLGVLRLPGIRARGKGVLARQLEAMLNAGNWRVEARALPLYLVGGSWRALARLDMHLTRYSLPIIHHYAMPAERAAFLARTVARMSREELAAIPSIASARVPMLDDAAALLAALVEQLGSGSMVVSAGGLREGLLYDDLTPDQRSLDPLIEAVRDEARRQGRFVEHGDLLFDWATPLFAGESPDHARLRRAACLLGDVGWHANPTFRAERGLETALHGNWVGVDGRGRAMIGQALHTSFGGGAGLLQPLLPLAGQAELETAVRWGLAMRLGQRLSGGTAPALAASTLRLTEREICLKLAARHRPLYGEVVERRHRQLASAFGRKTATESAD